MKYFQKHKSVLYCILIILFFFSKGFTQTISNVQCSQIGDSMIVSFDIINDIPVKIELYYSSNGDTIFTGPITHCSGDIGNYISKGNNKKIIWSGLQKSDILNGSQIMVRLKAKELFQTFSDNRTGNTYNATFFNNQLWMIENLNYEISDSWCYDNDKENCKKYGRLYDWNTAQNVCPKGWQIPTLQEWNLFIANAESKKNKNNANLSSMIFNQNAGYYNASDKTFFNIFNNLHIWSTTEKSIDPSFAYTITFSEADKSLGSAAVRKSDGYSVRCVQNGISELKQNILYADSKSVSLVVSGKKDIPLNKIPVNAFVKNYVETNIALWQKKGEFEKSNDYQIRVNENTRNKKIQDYTDEALAELKKEYSKTIIWGNFELATYDADNETYLIKSKEFGNIAIHVPTASAPSFKQNWNKIKFQNADYYVSDNKLFLAKLELLNPGENKVYIYDNKQNTTYSVKNIAYNFDEIKIDVKNQKQVNNTAINESKLTIGKDPVDTDIPVSKITKTNTYCLIIGNEDYSSNQTGINAEVNVQFAENDARIFKKYCENTLGIPEKNIILLINATSGKMLQNIDLLASISKANNGKAELIFYYAGHGLPDEQSKEPYLIPVDVAGSNLTYAVKLQDLYRKLSENPAERITVFLDACFSGGARNESLLSLRGVKIKAKENSLNNNLIVFSSSSGDESSAPWKEKQHGLFTYFLLKKIQESKGDITYQQLADYLKQEVSVNSLLINKKNQTPQVKGSPNIENIWSSWKLK